jgi:hypothetical protein
MQPLWEEGQEINGSGQGKKSVEEDTGTIYCDAMRRGNRDSTHFHQLQSFDGETKETLGAISLSPAPGQVVPHFRSVSLSIPSTRKSTTANVHMPIHSLITPSITLPRPTRSTGVNTTRHSRPLERAPSSPTSAVASGAFLLRFPLCFQTH